MHTTQELRAEIRAVRDNIEKAKRAAAKERQLDKKDANKNESEKRKREDNKKEKKQEEADKALLNSRKKREAGGSTKVTRQEKVQGVSGGKKTQRKGRTRRNEETRKGSTR